MSNGNNENKITQSKILKIEDNVLSYDYSFIQINHITQVQIGRPAKAPFPVLSIFMIIFGIILFSVAMSFANVGRYFRSTSNVIAGFVLVGVLLIIGAIAWIVVWASKKQPLCLMIYLSSGGYIAFLSYDEPFLSYAVEQLKVILNNNGARKNVIIDLSSSNIINGDVMKSNIASGQITDSNFVSGGTNVTGNTGFTTASGNIDVGNNPIVATGSANVNVGSGILDNSEKITIDWQKINDGLIDVIGKLNSDTKEHEIAIQLLDLVKKEDRHGFLSYLKAHSYEILTNVFSAVASTGLIQILTSILQQL